MLLRVELAGHVAPWRFSGSRPFDEWLSRCPWRADGGVAVVRVASPADAPPVARAIEREVYGCDAGASDVRTRAIAVDASSRSTVAAVCEALEVSPGQGRRATLLSLAAVLRAQRFVLFIDLSGLDETPSTLDELDGLLDDLAKLPDPAALTVVALARSGGARGAFDFARGVPVDRPLELLDTTRAWRCYVHVRLAWECAGEPSRARRWGDAVSERVAQEDDGAFEGLLNELAAGDWVSSSEGVRVRLVAWLENPRATSIERLVGEGMLWRPGPTGPLRPPPWIARALLPDAAARIRARLRGAVICAPLAEALIGACLDLEAQHRATCRPTGEPRAETCDAWVRFGNTGARGERMHYPNGCPATPIDAWDMASFGEHLAASVLPRALTNTLHDLRTLRNAMAHGHYACWRGVTELRAIARSLSLE
jgi:hypothetical protein